MSHFKWHISWFILILDHALTSELVVLNITNNGTRILIWFLESQDKVAILRMSINRKNVVRPLILYHFTALPKLNLENKSDISLIIMIKCVANLELDNWKTCLTWIHFRSKIIPNQLTIDSSGIFGFSGNIHANFRIENHHFKFCGGKSVGGKSPKICCWFGTFWYFVWWFYSSYSHAAWTMYAKRDLSISN